MGQQGTNLGLVTSPFPGRAAQGSHASLPLLSVIPLLTCGLPSLGIKALWTPTLPPTDPPICPVLSSCSPKPSPKG